MRGRLIVGLIVIGVIVVATMAFLSSDFGQQDDCLDAGGVWRNEACEGRRPGE